MRKFPVLILNWTTRCYLQLLLRPLKQLLIDVLTEVFGEFSARVMLLLQLFTPESLCLLCSHVFEDLNAVLMLDECRKGDALGGLRLRVGQHVLSRRF